MLWQLQSLTISLGPRVAFSVYAISTSLLQHYIVLHWRTPLKLLDLSIYHHNEISPYNREKATGIALAGMSERVIAAEIKCTRSYVRVAKELQNQAQGQSLPRGGRPWVYNDRDNRTILQNLRLHLKSTFEQRRCDTGLLMLNSHINKIAKATSIRH